MPYNPAVPNASQTEADTLKTLLLAVMAQLVVMNDINVGLTKEERSAGGTVGPRRKPFNDIYYANKDNYPDLKPGQTVVNDSAAGKHYGVQSRLGESKGLAKTIVEIIEDIEMNSEHYSYIYANKGRLAAIAGTAAGLVGADSFVDMLNEVYPDMGPDNDDGNP